MYFLTFLLSLLAAGIAGWNYEHVKLNMENTPFLLALAMYVISVLLYTMSRHLPKGPDRAKYLVDYVLANLMAIGTTVYGVSGLAGKYIGKFHAIALVVSAIILLLRSFAYFLQVDMDGALRRKKNQE